jgi:hypothetical protein
MHTVPAGYLRAFADESVERETPHVWRFERETAEPKLIGVRDMSVSKDIYTLRRTEGGPADATIETELLSPGVEDMLPGVIQLLASGETPGEWQWRNLSRFIAFQLARTQRAFQLLRDEGIRQRIEVGPNDPQLMMVNIAPFLEKWLCGMTWIVWENRSTFPFLTSDNPAVMWANRAGAVEGGVGFQDPKLQILCPLTPEIAFTAVQTPESLEAVLKDSPYNNPQFTDQYELRCHSSGLEDDGVEMLNLVTVTNAEKYVYSNTASEQVRRFLERVFFGRRGPVRRFDRRPIGSPVGEED